MKNRIKAIILTAVLFLSVSFLSNKITYCTMEITSDRTTNEVIKGEPYSVTATMYFPVASQCDSDPLVTAGMYKINPEKASSHKWIAMSRDLISRWGGKFKYGDLVEISGAGHKDGVYKVVDTMNKRFKNRIDFLETKGTKPYKFNNVTLTKITWKTPNNNKDVLASL